ncbi:hypothetical protein [Phormidium nigroviride]|uniref:hypothetical protein n=1 Tax=Phormidium nigroviride TaxID=482564 RepID=UPI0002EEA557|nr:hypothetical protein [Oscillatoria nigro-viridis]
MSIGKTEKPPPKSRSFLTQGDRDPQRQHLPAKTRLYAQTWEQLANQKLRKTF